VVAELDVSRAALLLSDEELGVAVMLLVAPDHPSLAGSSSQAAVARLERAGIVAGGKVQGYPARLLAVVAAPKLRVTIEKFVAGEPVVEQAWATEREGVLGAVTREGRIELTPVEPSLLPWAIARAVGLGPREHGEREPISVPAEVLGLAAEALWSGDGEAAAAAVADCEPAAGARLLELLRERRLSWTATSKWTDEGGEEHLTSVAVVDGGAEGLWLSSHEGEPPDAVVRLEPVRPSAVWERVVALMPADVEA
jgi:hypothetical protein